MKKVLIIDDDKELCEEMAEALKSEKYNVQTAFNGKSGKDIIEKDNFDIVILDYKMPDFDGIEILKTINRKRSAAKVLIMSGRPAIDKLLKDENLSEFVTDIISKPASAEALIEKIKTL